MDDVTAVIKTFLRDDYLKACLTSLRERHSSIRIFVADDGDEPSAEKKKFLHEYCDQYYRLPFDSGLPYARNYLMERVETEFILIGDDDFCFNADISPLRTLMGVSDLAGGRIVENGKVRDYQGLFRFANDGLECVRLNMLNFEMHEGIRYKPCGFTFNFFIARKAKLLPWDENIKISYEHEDFFLMNKDNARIVFCPDAFVTHKPPHVHIHEDAQARYGKYRNRRGDREYFFKKWGLSFFQDMDNNRDEL